MRASDIIGPGSCHTWPPPEPEELELVEVDELEPPIPEDVEVLVLPPIPLDVEPPIPLLVVVAEPVELSEEDGPVESLFVPSAPPEQAVKSTPSVKRAKEERMTSQNHVTALLSNVIAGNKQLGTIQLSTLDTPSFAVDFTW